MIPSNTFTPQPEVTPFVPPLDEPYQPLFQRVLGGVALNNPSEGRMYQIWTVEYTSGSIIVSPEGQPSAFEMGAVGVTAVSLAFDNNMGIVLGWQTASGANLYYYDTLTSSYTTRNFPGVTSCRVAVDDPRDFYTASSDVIFGYTISGNLYWRQQRDRYDVEYLVGPATGNLIKMGPNTGNRLQFMLV